MDDEIEKKKVENKKNILTIFYFWGLKCTMPWHLIVHCYNEIPSGFSILPDNFSCYSMGQIKLFLDIKKYLGVDNVFFSWNQLKLYNNWLDMT